MILVLFHFLGCCVLGLPSLPLTLVPSSTLLNSGDANATIFFNNITLLHPQPPNALPANPFVYSVPTSKESVKFYDYGTPVLRSPALICLLAAKHDFLAQAPRLQRPIGKELDYEVRGVILSLVPRRDMNCTYR